MPAEASILEAFDRRIERSTYVSAETIASFKDISTDGILLTSFS